MAKTPIEDLRPKGSRFFENLATNNTPQDLYTGRNFSGRLIDTHDVGGKKFPLDIPIKNKRSNGKSLLKNYGFFSTSKEFTASPHASKGPHIIITGNNVDKHLVRLVYTLNAPFATDTVVLLDFGFDKSWSAPNGFVNSMTFKGYSAEVNNHATDPKVVGEFSDMNSMAIVVLKGAHEIVFYADVIFPVDAKLLTATPAVHDIAYAETSIIYYDDTVKEHVSKPVPAKGKFVISGSKVSNIITLHAKHADNGDLLDILNGNKSKGIYADPEIFARYLLQASHGFDPKDPANPIPTATRYYPVSESKLELYDMMSRAYHASLHLTADYPVAALTDVYFRTKTNTKIKINGITYDLLKKTDPDPSKNFVKFQVNNTLYDGDILITFDHPQEIDGISFRQTNGLNSLIGSMPDLKIFANVTSLNLGNNKMFGPLKKYTLSNKITTEVFDDQMFSGMAKFDDVLDVSACTNPEFKRFLSMSSHANGFILPPQIEYIRINNLNACFDGSCQTNTKVQDWKELFKGMTKLKEFICNAVYGVSGEFPDPKNCPDLTNYNVARGKSGNGSNMSGLFLHKFPSFEDNHKIESIVISDTGTSVLEPWPKLHAAINLRTFSIYNMYLQRYMGDTKVGEPADTIFPDFSKNTKLEKIVLNAIGSSSHGKLYRSMLPDSLVSFTHQDATQGSVMMDAAVAQMPNLTSFRLANQTTIECDPSFWNGNSKIESLTISTGTRSINLGATGTLCDVTTMPGLVSLMIRDVKNITGTFKKPLPALKNIDLGAGWWENHAEEFNRFKMDGGFPDLASNSFNSFAFMGSTIGHEGGVKAKLPVLTGSYASLGTLNLSWLPNIADTIPDVNLFIKLENFIIRKMEKLTGVIPSIEPGDNRQISITISGCKGINGFATPKTGVCGNINTGKQYYTDNSLTAKAVEDIIIAYSKGSGIANRLELHLDNPEYDASVKAHAADPKVPIQGWKNEAPDVNKASVKTAIALLRTKKIVLTFAK